MINNTAISGSKNGSSDIDPLVSVLVPSYNHEKYVIECLESIKSQDYRRLELIVSDDSSQDSTFALVEEWIQRNAGRFERAIAVKQPKNLGVVRNLQFLFDNAQGEYLTYVASDDLLLPSGVSNRGRALQKNKDVDAVFGNAQLVSESGVVLQKEFIPKRIVRELSSGKLLVSSLLLNWCVPGPVMMLRKKAVLESGSLGILPVDLKAEDRYIYIRLASRKKLRFVNAVVAKYRAVQDSMSRHPSQYSFIVGHIAQSDKRNRHLLSGFNRFVIESKIARYDLELNKGNIANYQSKKLFWRLVTMPLKMVLFIRAMAFKN